MSRPVEMKQKVWEGAKFGESVPLTRVVKLVSRLFLCLSKDKTGVLSP